MILDRKGIEEILPQRDPFLFVDKVLELEEGKRLVASYTFPPDAYFFKGHFPGRPVVPGVLLIEAIAQAAGVLGYKTVGCTWREKRALLIRVDKVFFRKPVLPGEELVMELLFEHHHYPITKFYGKAAVSGNICAEATIMATFDKYDEGSRL